MLKEQQKQLEMLTSIAPSKESPSSTVPYSDRGRGRGRGNRRHAQTRT